MSTQFNIVVFGAGGVGKSALVIQFATNSFVEEYDPTIEDSYRKLVNVDDVQCLFEILDTAGPEEYSSMIIQYIRAGQGFLLVYSVTSRSSFDDINAHRDRIIKEKGATFPMVLVGNKIDLESERAIAACEGTEWAKEFGCPFFETSAKVRVNVDECLYQLAREIIKQNPGENKKKENKKQKCLIQ
eukprot:TRINITY_DN2243_c0_g1_i1.p1 TRINITY_DN2243_c0_g1~~TRINITY_DN2243_c0_g1_i1.p1  ORF type:complete len:186 (-),score=46.18 TRINITY_DN2243_c0_g1_i1:202-759(-)